MSGPLFEVMDVSIGEEVEVQFAPWSVMLTSTAFSHMHVCKLLTLGFPRVDDDLIGCGQPRSLLPVPFKGKWVRAVVQSLQPSTSLTPGRFQSCDFLVR